LDDVPELTEGSIAFVASLLPAAFLVEHASQLRIRRVIVSSAALMPSFERVAALLPPPVVVEAVPMGPVGSAGRIAARIWSAKRRGETVVFFHECCWPVFDLLVDFLAAPAMFFPQVTMSGFDVVDPSEVPRAPTWAHRAKRALFGFVAGRFVAYRAPKQSGSGGYDYFLRYRQYPSTVRPFAIAPRLSLLARANQISRSVLLIAGTEAVPDEELRQIYRTIIGMARDYGYRVIVKDHPLSPLNIDVGDCDVIDAFLPVELLDESFTVSIGVASTGLLAVGGRKVSLVNVLESMPPKVKRMRMQHLQALPGAAAIEFVDSLEAIRHLLHDEAARASA